MFNPRLPTIALALALASGVACGSTPGPVHLTTPNRPVFATRTPTVTDGAAAASPVTAAPILDSAWGGQWCEAAAQRDGATVEAAFDSTAGNVLAWNNAQGGGSYQVSDVAPDTRVVVCYLHSNTQWTVSYAAPSLSGSRPAQAMARVPVADRAVIVLDGQGKNWFLRAGPHDKMPITRPPS